MASGIKTVAAAMMLGSMSGVATARSMCPPVFYDGNFASWDWTTSVVRNADGVANVSTSTSTGVTTGGVPSNGPYLRVDNQISSVSPPNSGNNRVWNVSIYQAQAHDPATDGAIQSIEYCEESISLNSSQRSGPAILQNGLVFVYNPTAANGINTTPAVWTHSSLAGLQQTDFWRICLNGNCNTQGGPNGPFVECDSASHPDFSASGAPIQFGFYRVNSTRNTAYSTSVGIDRWSVPVTKTCNPDFNNDGVADQGDIDAMVNVIAGGPCP